MSLSQVLATAVTGLHATQAGLSVVAANVANAETPGYVRKTASQVTTAAGELGVGVRVASINRELDQYLQRQLRIESSGASYAELRAQFYSRLQTIYGTPGSDSALETVFNKFMTALQGLSTSPDSASARSAVLSSAQVLAQQLNGMTSAIQGLRSDAELGLADSVARANDAMAQIAAINQQLGTATRNDATTATLLDQRDHLIDELSQLMDINVVPTDHNQVTVFTKSGIQLIGNAAATLSFDAQGSMTAAAQWSADPTQRSVGTLVLKAVGGGGDIDLIATNAIRSGKIAAYLEMRDRTLVEAQTQLDELAAGMARALSDRTIGGTAVTSGAQTGFDVDLSGMLAGNTVKLTYTDAGGSHTLTLMRVDDPAALPLSNNVTADPNDRVIGLNFSGGMASVVSQIVSALGATPLQVSNPSGMTLRVLDDGAANTVDVNALSVSQTVTGLAGGTPELPFFLDGNSPFSGAVAAVGMQTTGFAGRIAVNGALAADPAKLVAYQATTAAGDPSRPNFIYDRLNGAALTFSPKSGIGSTVAPFTGSIPDFLRQVISQQGQAAENADSLNQGQQVVLNSLKERFNDGAGVNIDVEMSNLLQLQTAYAANARVMTTVRDMLDALMKL
jgi:flagellar hook-associated protein 1 FlgK